jgi:two-component system chemotaxis response regulator CheY
VKAIVIDDSRATRTILKRALTAHGFEVMEADNGRSALDVLAGTGPLDLALVDWNMPVMTGYEFIVEVRTKPELNAMAIMMVTTETETVQITRALEAGANEYVMKPFTDAVLQEKLMLLGLLDPVQDS